MLPAELKKRAEAEGDVEIPAVYLDQVDEDREDRLSLSLRELADTGEQLPVRDAAEGPGARDASGSGCTLGSPAHLTRLCLHSTLRGPENVAP